MPTASLPAAGAAGHFEIGDHTRAVAAEVYGVMGENVKACERCVMTTVDPETAERGREPLATLARTRRWDGKTWFGVNLIPDVTDPSGADAPRIAVGDEVEVLESVPPGEGPLRTPIQVH